MKKSNKITSVQVAELAGVSQITVSRALSGRVPVSEETHRKIMEAVRKLGYKPHGAARAARTGKTGNIGLLLSTTKSQSRLPSQLIQSVHDALHGHGLHLTVARLSEEQLRDEYQVSNLMTNVVSDGLIFNYTHDLPEGVLEWLERYQIPAVWINTKTGSDCIIPDDRKAGAIATRHLVDLGHRNIGYLAFRQSGHFSEKDRCTGYEDAMRSAGLIPKSSMIATTPPLSGDEIRDDNRLSLCRDYLEAPDRPTGIVTYSMKAAEALHAVSLQIGLKIPGDLSIVTIGDHLSNPLGITFTTALISAEEVGTKAVEAVLKKIQSPGTPLAPVTIPPVLRPGSSTQPLHST